MRKVRLVVMAALICLAGVGAQLSVTAPAHASAARVTPADEPAAGAAAFAEQQIGKPYAFGMSGPASYDSSGLVQAAYASVGVALPHNSAAQCAATARVYRADLQVGDLVFYGTGAATVAIYAGDDEVVGVYTPATRVHISAIDFAPVYAYGRVTSAARVFAPWPILAGWVARGAAPSGWSRTTVPPGYPGRSSGAPSDRG